MAVRRVGRAGSAPAKLSRCWESENRKDMKAYGTGPEMGPIQWTVLERVGRGESSSAGTCQNYCRRWGRSCQFQI